MTIIYSFISMTQNGTSHVHIGKCC